RRGPRGLGHFPGSECPVIEQDECICERRRVGYPGLCGKRLEALAHPAAVLLDGQLLGLARRRLGGGIDERAAPELRKRHVVSDRVEDSEDLLLRIIDAGLCSFHTLAPRVQAASKV